MSLQRNDGGDIILTIKDDSVGISADFDFYEAESFGLRLVRILTKQLEGYLEFKLEQGTCFEITFF